MAVQTNGNHKGSFALEIAHELSSKFTTKVGLLLDG